MKKPLTKIAILSSLVVSISAASAAVPTAELKVVGTMTVPSCTVVSPDAGIYDIGKLSSSLVKPGTTVTVLAQINKTWTVNCDANTYLNFTPVDNRVGSSSDGSAAAFGLGKINDTGKIGYYTVQMRNATVDGKKSGVFTASSASFSQADTSYLNRGQRTGWAAGANTQNSGKVFVADLLVTPVLAGTNTMNGAITEDAKIDGSLTMNFAFGI